MTVICCRKFLFCIDAQTIKKLWRRLCFGYCPSDYLYVLSKKLMWISGCTLIVTDVQPRNSAWKEAYNQN